MNEIMTVNADKIAKFTGYSSEEVAIIKQTVAKGTTDAELAYFLSVAKASGLNPFNKEVWCYKDGKGNLLVFTGRDGFLSKAQSNPDFNGIRSSEVKENDVFGLDIANNVINHSFGVGDRGKIIGAYAIIFRKDGEPTIEWADFETYNKGYNTWKTNPAEMIKKVAESHGLKKAFGISGIQSEYDFEVKDNVVIPVDFKEVDELAELKKEYIKLIDKQDKDFAIILKNEVKEIDKAGKLTIEKLQELIGKLK